MATIALYAGKINNMPGLIKDVRKSVEKYNKELAGLYQKTLKVDADVCDLGEVMDSLRASSQTQEQRIEMLENFQENSEDFIQDTIRIDNNVADTVDQNKDDFYDKYDYLKPDCEKSGWEKFCDACKAVGEWCKEHWKLIVTVVLVVVAVVVIVVTAGAGAGPIAMLLAGMAKGLLGGALMGGLLGGLSSVAAGGSFLEGFENGAFSGALMGALMGGIGAAGSLLGGSCTFAGTAVGRLFDTVIPIMGKVTGGISGVMALFDTAAFVGGLFDPGNALTQLNQKLHENAAYNVFQITVSTLAVFSGGFMKGAQNRACFVAGTMVLTACGLVAIENIKAGDKVVATNPDTGVSEEKTVIETFLRSVTELVHLTINGELITTTLDHPFYVSGKGFVKAGILCTNDILMDNQQNPLIIDKISFESTEPETKVYNLKVEDYHDYHVGVVGVLVHNADYPSHMNADGTLKPDTEYTTGEYDYQYKTNSDGCIESVHADELHLKAHDGRLPHDANTGGKLSSDHAGHLIADQFGGSPKLDNLVSQDGYLNTHQYRSMERTWANALSNGQPVTDVNIKVSYPPNSTRPNGFTVSYKIDGVRSFTKFRQ